MDAEDEPFSGARVGHGVSCVVGDEFDEVRGFEGAVAGVGVLEDILGDAGLVEEDAPVGEVESSVEMGFDVCG